MSKAAAVVRLIYVTVMHRCFYSHLMDNWQIYTISFEYEALADCVKLFFF